ncbi:MAG: hypothetical protein Ct9H300mP28_27490 [Pseudomonadota bacterium]|nr:MAG: hypothetical protein Ct9H300mP28_27490 [Pseudomonadota bacterium]
MRTDLSILRSMCKQAEEFGKALKLDSVSTFECIVEGSDHYFMEVNTRIQVEHRVTEMVYSWSFPTLTILKTNLQLTHWLLRCC